MSELQTALIILGALVLLALILFSRRGKKSVSRHEPAATPASPLGEATGKREGNNFDDLGVGKPRKRSGEPEPVVVAKATEKIEATVYQQPVRTPAFVKPATTKVSEKLITLYVAEREGTKINGVKVHAALEEQKLSYNEKNKAYDRLIDGRVQYSVTSLTAPGYLDRTLAATFSTPGLGIFLRLPGPAQPKAALRDMLTTAEALAKSLKAVLFDAAHQPLTEDSVRRLVAEIEDWARVNKA